MKSTWLVATALLVLPAGCEEDENVVFVPDLSAQVDMGPRDMTALPGADLRPPPVAPDLAMPPPPAAAAVQVGDNVFVPSVVSIPAGGSVTWTWAGAVSHTVTSEAGPNAITPDGRFCSAVTTPSVAACAAAPPQLTGMFRFTFTVPGSYPYYCKVHGAMMQGTVVVVAAP